MRSLLSRSRSRFRSWPWFVPLLLLTHVLTIAAGCGRSELEPLGSGNVGSGGRGGAGAAGLGGHGGATATQLPPTPGLILCGSTICLATVQQCCLGLGAGGLDAQCVAPGTACPGATVQCDEPADCSSPTVCCAGFLTSSAGSGGQGAGAGGLIPGLTIGSRCEARTSCSGVGELIVCRANADCGAGAVCCPGLGVATCQTSCTTL